MLDILDPDQEISFDELEGTPSESIIDTSQVLFYSCRPNKPVLMKKLGWLVGIFFQFIILFYFFTRTLTILLKLSKYLKLLTTTIFLT